MVVEHVLVRVVFTQRDDVRLAVVEVPTHHSLVWTEQMMPVMPVVTVANVDEAIDLAGHAIGVFILHDEITRMKPGAIVAIWAVAHD